MAGLRMRQGGPVMILAILLGATAWAAAPTFKPDAPNAISFPARDARFVRLAILGTGGGPACIDELEVYGPDGAKNLALAASGAKATASSALAGYAYHKIENLNDGQYGNEHSWIAAAANNQWAQIELPAAAKVAKVAFSRDRQGHYRDRMPLGVEVSVSLDGKKWETVGRVKSAGLAAAIAAARTPPKPYAAPVPLPKEPSYDDLVRYAMLCEKATWQRIPSGDHLSPLQTDRPALPGGPPYWTAVAKMDPLGRTLFLFEQMIDRLAANKVKVDAERKELAGLRGRQAKLTAGDAAAAEALYLDARLAKRRLMFRDPDLAPLGRILFVKRQPYHPSHNYSDILDSRFLPGGGVCVLETPLADGRLTPDRARLVTLFDAGQGIARDPMADFDAARVYFAYRPPEPEVAGQSLYWHLMAVDASGGAARQLTHGPFQDYYPCPLPDGGLAFISTRCRSRFLCWRPQAFVLFRMNADGEEMRPLSFANLSEWAPSVMNDGRIIWTRSEYLDKGANFGHTLWAIRPDGTHPELIFGNDTPNCYMNGREVPGTRELCCTLISHGGDLNGPIGLVDRAKGPFTPAAITNITPDARPHYDMAWPRQECFRDPVPVARDYFLVSHAPADRFGLFVIDRYGNRELLYLDPAMGSMCPTLLRAVPHPPIIPQSATLRLAKSPAPVRDPRVVAAVSRGMPGMLPGGMMPGRGPMMPPMFPPHMRRPQPSDTPDVDEDTGQFTVADVYQGLGPNVKRGTVKYLRVCEEVRPKLEQLPNGEYRHDHNPFPDFYATPIHKVHGPAGWPTYVAKASLGLVPVEADGSASFYAPSGKVLYFELLDENFTEIQRMRSVVQLQPGEQRSCVGCHENRQSTSPSPATLASAGPPRQLETPPWGDGPLSYEKVVQPVLNARCTSCHAAGDQHGISLAGTLDAERIPASYRTLIAGGWVHYFNCQYGVRPFIAEPLSFGTAKSRLWQVLDAGHHNVKLTPEETHRIKCWIDLNCPLWPDYIYRLDRPGPDAALTKKSSPSPSGRGPG